MGFTMVPHGLDAQEIEVSSSAAGAEESAAGHPVPAASQSPVGPQPSYPAVKVRRFYDPERIDLSLGTFPQLTGTRTTAPYGLSDNEAVEGITPSAGVLGTFHQQLSPWIGYNLNLGYTRTAENLLKYVGPNGGPGFASSVSVGTNVYELSVGMVSKGPVATRRMQTFSQGGGGVLTFLPTQKNFPGAVQIRPAALFGAGVDYRVSAHLGLRMEYRGLFYKTPDFRDTQQIGNKVFTVTSEPTISLIYRFGAHRQGMQ
jgi:opacity protein-like surface antigen